MKVYLLRTILLSVLLVSALICVRPATAYSQEPILISVTLSGLSSKVPLSNTTLSVALINGEVFANNILLGEVMANEEIRAQTTLSLPPTYIHEKLSFIISLQTNNMTPLYCKGFLSLDTMESQWDVLNVDPSTLKSDGGKLSFTSIGIVGTIKVEVSAYPNATSLTAALTWKNETIGQTAKGPNMEFTYANLTSNIPEIPFELNISLNEAINIIYAVGKFQVTPEKVYMPISINQWNRHYISGWNITFICQKYATTSELPIAISSQSSKEISPPGSYTADFRENTTTQKPFQETSSNPSLLDQILSVLLTPTFIMLVVVLTVVGFIACAIKLKRHK